MLNYIFSYLTCHIWHGFLSEQASLYISEKLKPYGNTLKKSPSLDASLEFSKCV